MRYSKTTKSIRSKKNGDITTICKTEFHLNLTELPVSTIVLVATLSQNIIF